MERYELRMNTKISISTITKIVNILFLIVLENFALDCGMGFFGASCLAIAILYTLLFNGLQSGISKIVSIRNNKGLNSNAKHILRPALIYVSVIGVNLTIIGLITAEAFCRNVWGTAYPAPVLQVVCLLFLLNGITDVLCGYQNGNGNAIVPNIANLLRMILPIPSSFFLLSSLNKYGDKAAALLKNTTVTSAYSALAVTCIYTFSSIVVLLVVIFLNIRLRVSHSDGKMMRTMDSKRVMYGGIFSSSFKIALNQLFPLFSVAVTALIYIQFSGKYGISPEKAFINIGALFVKLLLPVSFVFVIFSEYITREKYRLHMDFKKDDYKTATIRSQYMIKNSFFMLLPPAVILTFLADPFVKVFFTGQYTLSAKILQTGGFLVLLAGVVHALNAILKAADMEFAALGIQCVSFLVQILFLILMLSKSSGSSMSILYSFYLFYGFQLVLNFALVYRFIRLDLMDILMKLGKYGASAIVMMVLFIILDKFVLMNVFLILLSMFLGYLLYYLTLLALKGISKKDEMALKRTLNYYPVAFLKSRLRL